MIAFSVLSTLAFAVPVAEPVVGEESATRLVPSALVEKALPADLALPVCDMAVTPLQVDWVRGILVVWNGEWAVRSIGAGAASDPGGNVAKTATGGTREVLEKQLAAIANEAAPDGEPAREASGFSTRPIFVAVGGQAPSGRVFDAVRACAAPDVFAARIWFLARDAEGRVGALPVHLPVDGPGRDPRVTPATVNWTLCRNDVAAAASKLPGPLELAFALREASGASAVGMRLGTTDIELPAAPLFAIVNECRRFGFRTLFRLPEETEAPNDESTVGAVAGACVKCEPPIHVKNTPPKIVPGKALFGDPRKNS